MLPEILRNEEYQAVDHDLFAFGVALFVARNLAFPFDYANESMDVYYKNLVEGNLDFWKLKGPDNSDSFKDLITKMLQSRP